MTYERTWSDYRLRCTNVWLKIYTNPGMTKEQAYTELNYPLNFHNELTSTCQACDVAQLRRDKDLTRNAHPNICHYCPMKGKWPTINGEFIQEYCTSSLGGVSAYQKWSVLTLDSYTDTNRNQKIKTYAFYVLKAIQHWE